MEYLENNFDIEFQDIPGWQIKSVVVNTYGNYEDREKFGIRVIRNDMLKLLKKILIIFVS